MGGEKIRAAVVGATGYGGAEIVRLLDGHPRAEVTHVTSSRNPGKRLDAECPWIATDLVLSPFEPSDWDGVDVVFLCQEAGFAMEHAVRLAERFRVIDLSADFRLADPLVYEAYYGRTHSAPHVPATFGMCELTPTAEIASARILANPGCYPTSASLALAPLVRAGVVSGVPVIDSKSGVSGAGRSRKETDYLFSELEGSFKAYGLRGHRHVPEIEQAVGTTVRFTPHLLPMARGILTTIHVPLSEPIDVAALWRETYAGRPFVRVVDTPPTTKQVRGSNRCDLYATYDDHTGFAVLVSVIDNLVKGAAGQAVQNMNLMFGLPETEGLPLHGLWP